MCGDGNDLLVDLVAVRDNDNASPVTVLTNDGNCPRVIGVVIPGDGNGLQVVVAAVPVVAQVLNW